MNLPKINKGFTLIEILLVVGILSILLVVVFAALNPARRLIDTRNARRWNDVNQYLTAVHECIIDNDLATCNLANDGVLRQIGNCASGGATLCAGADAACEGDLDASPMTGYLGSTPLDPSVGTTDTTAYSIQITNGIVTIASCNEEDPGTGAPVISVTR